MASRYTSNWKAVCPKCDAVYNSKKNNYICTNCEKGFIKANFEHGTGKHAYLGCNRCGEMDITYDDCDCGATYKNQIRQVKSYLWLYILLILGLGLFVYNKIQNIFHKDPAPAPIVQTQPATPPQEATPAAQAEEKPSAEQTTEKP